MGYFCAKEKDFDHNGKIIREIYYLNYHSNRDQDSQDIRVNPNVRLFKFREKSIASTFSDHKFEAPTFPELCSNLVNFWQKNYETSPDEVISIIRKDFCVPQKIIAQGIEKELYFDDVIKEGKVRFRNELKNEDHLKKNDLSFNIVAQTDRRRVMSSNVLYISEGFSDDELLKLYSVIYNTLSDLINRNL